MATFEEATGTSKKTRRSNSQPSAALSVSAMPPESVQEAGVVVSAPVRQKAPLQHDMAVSDRDSRTSKKMRRFGGRPSGSPSIPALSPKAVQETGATDFAPMTGTAPLQPDVTTSERETCTSKKRQRIGSRPSNAPSVSALSPEPAQKAYVKPSAPVIGTAPLQHDMATSERETRTSNKNQGSSVRRSAAPTMSAVSPEGPQETGVPNSALMSPTATMQIDMAMSERETRTSKKSRGPCRRPSVEPRMPELSPEAALEAGPTVSAPVTGTTPAVITSPLDRILIFGHGWLQRLILLCTTLAFFTTVLHVSSLKSLARPVDHWCRPPPKYANLPPEVWKNSSVPLDADGLTRSQCLRYEPPVPSSDFDGFENRSAIPCDAGWDFGTDATSDKPVNSIIKEWNLVCDRHWMVPALMVAYMFGGVVGTPLAGVAADKIGRYPVLCTGLLLFAFAGIALVFAKTILTFAVLRALLSAGATIVLVMSAVVLFEVTDTQHRALFCSLAIVAGKLTASIYGALVHDVVSDWKAAQTLFMLPTCTLVLVVYHMKESPCWLLAVLDMKRAENVLSWGARVNGADPDIFKLRLSALKVEHKRQLENQPGTGISKFPSPPKDVDAMVLIRNQALRNQSLVLFGCCFIVFTVYYDLAMGQLVNSVQGANTVLALLQLPGIPLSVLIITHAGRRMTLAISMITLAVVASALAIAHAVHAPSTVLAATVVLWMLVFEACLIAVLILPAELYPTVVRGAGFSFCYTCGRVGAFVAPFLKHIQSANGKGLLYAVAAAMLLFFGVKALALPETTKLQPANTMRDMAAEKWILSSPLRVARRSGKRKRTRSSENEYRTASRTGSVRSVRSENEDTH